jgi:leader peptidase (prepilin peptidase)/N-methyltransferase
VSAVYPSWQWLVMSAALGAVLGSFLNVVIYRIPRGLSVVSPPSACPRCEARIAPHDNVPILGWLILGGKCRACKGPISIRYPGIESLTAILFLVLAWRFGLTWELLPALVFASAMIAVTFIDFDHQIIPDVITLSGVPLGLASTFVRPLGFMDAAIGAALGFGLLLGIATGYRKVTGRDGMGGGDIKLAAMLGAFLGWKGLLVTVFLASLGGSAVGLLLMALGTGGRRTALPFGTFLAPASLVAYIWGDSLIAWYGAILRP